jgi:hypothetical protein
MGPPRRDAPDRLLQDNVAPLSGLHLKRIQRRHEENMKIRIHRSVSCFL